MQRMEQISRISLIGLLLLVFLAAAAAVWATATYTAPPPAGSRSAGSTNRYAAPVEGLAWIDIVTDDINDVTIELDPDLAGYLERVSWSHDGNDTSWSLSILDDQGNTLWSTVDANALGDPNTAIAALADEAGTSLYGGIPIGGGALSLVVADANQARAHYSGDGNAITVRLYLREVWRR